MTIVQAFDGVIDAFGHNPSKTYGPFAFALVNALAVGWLLREQRRHPNRREIPPLCSVVGYET
jgi:hypothetical protein